MCKLRHPYPAVNWFSFCGLGDYLGPLGFYCIDRFYLIGVAGKDALARAVIRMLREASLLRCLGHDDWKTEDLNQENRQTWRTLVADSVSQH